MHWIGSKFKKFWENHCHSIITGIITSIFVGVTLGSLGWFLSWHGGYEGFKGEIKAEVKGICSRVGILADNMQRLVNILQTQHEEEVVHRLSIKHELEDAKNIAERANQKASRIEKMVDDLRRDQLQIKKDLHDHKMQTERGTAR